MNAQIATFGPTMKKYLFVLLWIGSTALAQDSFTEAKRFFDAGKFAQAQPLFESYLKSNPNHITTLLCLGDIAAASKDWHDALVYFQKARQLKPNVADYHYRYGGALGMVAKESNKFKALGMIGDVRGAFEKALAIDPQHIGAHWALIELNLQLPAIAGGSTKKAKEYAESLARISPVDGWLAKGRIAEDSEHFSEAEKCYKKAIAIGQSKTTYQKLADLYTKTKQPEKAKATMAAYHKKQKE